MHFFRPIQQSAVHIYHSALPLSPSGSMFHSKTLGGKTKIRRFVGRPDTWGLVVRTITAGNSESSTCVTAFGHRIAIACDDGTVAVCDSVTGVLKLSLSPEDPVQTMRGSPDGSILFCTHQRPSVTSWDLQTGGLIHTFIPGSNVEDIAVSLKGRYLACRLLECVVKIWEVATKRECAAIESGLLDTHLCWLEPEDHLAVAIGPSVRIWDVASSTTIRLFTLQGAVHGMIYPPRLDRLIIVTISRAGDAVHIIDPLQRVPSTSYEIHRRITCFTFSQTTNQLVCGRKADGLELFDISTQRWRSVHYPDRATLISSLPNGTVIANFTSSGVQVLSLDDGHPPSQRPSISTLTVHAFDEDRIVAVLPTSRDRVVLLDQAKMSELLTIPAHKGNPFPVDRANILCASLANHVAAHYFQDSGKWYLQLWKFGVFDPRWTVETNELPSAGGISPDGTRIVTFHDVYPPRTYVSVRDARHGGIEARIKVKPTLLPYDITFDSAEKFYSHHDTFRIPFVVSSPEPRDRHRPPYRSASSDDSLSEQRVPYFSASNDDSSSESENYLSSRTRIIRTSNAGSSSKSVTLSHRIILQRGQPLTGPPQKRCYDVDDTCEWVVSGSKRICWIPPGYLGSVQPRYWWTGHLLVTAGQDGTIRWLAFGK